MEEPRIFLCYSHAFKQKVASEIESGKVTPSEAQRVNNIKGCGTIPSWLNKLGKAHLMNRVVRIEMEDEKDRIKNSRMVLPKAP